MTQRWYPAAVGLGSNLGDPPAQIRRALSELAGLPRTLRTRVSSLYASRPMGPQDQPDYVNAVALLMTQLSPRELLQALQDIEAAHGRERAGERWGPRTLDLDLLLYADRFIDEERLTVPHPGIAERNFVLLPLAEIAPHWLVPGRGSVQSLRDALPECSQGIERLGAAMT